MNNYELQELFSTIMLRNSNIFDTYIELAKYKSQYKKSMFYKQTHKDIYEAFNIYIKGIGSLDYLISLFKNVNENDIAHVMNHITQSLSLKEITNDLDSSDKEILTMMLKSLQ